MLNRNNVLLFTDSNWNPEQDLPVEERRVISPDDFRAGGVTISNPDLLKYLAANPQDIFSLTSRQFEELVAELLRKSGYEPRLGSGSHDGGVDVRALRVTETGLDLTLVQCKRWDPGNKSRCLLVKQLSDDVRREGATRDLIVTTAPFTRGALQRIEESKYQLAGKGLKETQDWIRRAVEAQ